MNTIKNRIAMRIIKPDCNAEIVVGTEKQIVEYIIKNQNDFQWFEKCTWFNPNKSEVFTKVIVAVDSYSDESTLVHNINTDSYKGALKEMIMMQEALDGSAHFELCDVIYLSDNQ